MQSMQPEGEPRLLFESAVLGVDRRPCRATVHGHATAVRLRLPLFIAGYRAPGVEPGAPLTQHIGPHGLWLIPVVTTLGGLISGFIVYHFAPEAEGHGTDTAVNAFHREEGIIRPRVAPLKMIASAITIGSGGSAGREGPIALITATLGSWYARLAHRSEEQRRLLLLAGMAGGLAAIFRSPMGTGVFAIEVLYGTMEFEVGALLYTMCSSAVAYAVNGLFVGYQPLFHIPTVAAPALRSYGPYALLGLAAGAVGTLLPEVFYRIRDAFRALPIPLWTKPAVGGLGVGLLALVLPQVLQGGYGWIQLAIDGRLALHLLLILVFAKIIAFSLSVSSGGSGGVFAPSLYVGAMLGGAFAIVLHQPSPIFVVVGMAAVFGAAARVPVATMLMVTEMTGGYHLLVPAGMAVMIAYLLQQRLSTPLKYHSMYEGQVPTRADSPAHYLDQIQTAFNLLSKRDMHVTGAERHIDLLRLLRSHIRFDLPGDREVSLALIPSTSPIAGKTVADFYLQLGASEFEIVTIARHEHVLLPRPSTILKPEDRLLLVTSPESRSALARFLTPLPQSPGAGEPEPPPEPPAPEPQSHLAP